MKHMGGRARGPAASSFASAARLVGEAARRAGLEPPAFRSPPGLPGRSRTIRRLHDGRAVVSVAVRDRSPDRVLADLVEGVLVANRVPPRRARDLRCLLRAEVATPDAA